MKDTTKAKLVILLTPILFFSGIFGYLHYQEYTENKKAIGAWEYYGYIKSHTVKAPKNLTGFSFYQGMIDSRSCQEYPVEFRIFYQGYYECHNFLMPWGEIEAYWTESEIGAFMRWTIS